MALLTAGRDKHYALGLASALVAKSIAFDLIGSAEICNDALRGSPIVNVLNLRDQAPGAGAIRKTRRVLAYYCRLIGYAASSEASIFHILWNNKFELFDRTVLMLYYKLLGKRIVFTAHNVNAGERDANDSWLNRASLWCHYRMTDHVLVHTERMKRQLITDFGLAPRKVTVIPYGINNIVPHTDISRAEARERLGLASTDKTILFFGNIAPYKGLEYLVEAFAELAREDDSYRLIVSGAPKWSDEYWRQVEAAIASYGLGEKVMAHIEYIPDEKTELYFKAADVSTLPYTHIFQSGILFLGYSFGLPAIVADVGSLREDVMEGETGYVCKPRDAADLAACLRRYFDSDLFKNLESRRAEVKAYATERHSWETVAELTTGVYRQVCQ